MGFVGIDAGSTYTKAVIIDNSSAVLAQALRPTGWNVRSSADQVLHQILMQTGFETSDLNYVVATGYGRGSLTFASEQVTEIACFAKGISHLLPRARTIIDVGGQDSKGIKIDASGRVIDFVMNDKCAAGTGRFLEVMARAVGVNLEDFGKLSLLGENPVEISSICAVFAESQVISLVAEGRLKENIIAGIHQTIAKRIYGMVSRLNIEGELAFSGGGAQNIGLITALEIICGVTLSVPQNPQYIGAIGAALIARARAAAIE